MNGAGANVPNYRMLISRLTASGQWDRVLETAREWLSADADNSRAHLAAGQALLNLKRYAEADPHLQQALAREPGNSTAYRFMSIAHFHQKRFKQADEAIQKAISLSPEDYYNWYHLAWMFYRQGDHASAAKYAQRARELNPRDADIVNLLALCTPNDPALAAQKLRQYEAALELDPENAEVHNNIGAYHLNVTRNFALAEEWFRRALFFNPASQTARSNLFIAIKHRDQFYRLLRMPRDGLLQGFSFMRKARKKSVWIYFLLLPLWIVAFRFIIAGLILWCLLVWPLIKVYEFLTIGDIRARAGEVGSRRGGFLGYRKWPLRARLSIFGVCLLCFWGTLVWIFCAKTDNSNRDDVAAGAFGVFIALFLLYLLFAKLRAATMESRAKKYSRQRAKRMGPLLNTEGRNL